MMKLYSVIISLLLFSSGLNAQLDSLKKEFALATDGARQYKLSRDIYNFYEEENRDSGLAYAEKGIVIARKYGNKIAEGQSLVSKGYQLIALGRLAEGLRSLLDAFTIADDPKLKADDDWNIATYSFNGDKKKLLKSHTHHIFGILMIRTENVQQQIFHFTEAARIGKEIGYAPREMLAYMNLGQVYLSINKLDSSLYYLKLSEQTAYRSGFLKYLGLAEFYIGDVYKARGDETTALTHYYNAMQASIEQKNQNGLGRSYLRLLKHYLAAGNKDSALFYARNNLRVTQSLGLVTGVETNLGLAYEYLSKSYELSRQPDSASKYLKLALTSKDSLNNTRIRNLSDFQNLSFAEQIRLQNLEKEREQYQNKIWTYALLSGIGVVFLVAIILYRNNRQKNKTNKVLAQTLSNLQATQADLEVKNSELEIEAALERVRSVANAMQNSNDLLSVITIVGQQLEKLGLQFDSTNFRTNVGEKDWDLWIYAKWLEAPRQWYVPYIDHPYFRTTEVEGEVSSMVFSKEERDSFNAYLSELGLIEISADAKKSASQKEYFDSSKGFAWSIALGKKVSLNIANGEAKPYTEEEKALLMRFTIAFEQAYTRFLDLQKAEEQSREAQIELGLERVRARAMAMQHSEELAELVDTVFKELTRLHFSMNRCQISIMDPDGISMRNWMANPEIDKTPNSYLLIANNHPYFQAMEKAWKEKQPKWIYHLYGEEKTELVKYVFSETEFRNLPEMVKKGMIGTTDIYFNSSFQNFGNLQVDTLEPLSEENLDIVNRFGKVFDLSYTRFNDLQKAEAQTREVQIELGLERVRAKAMAMQNSDELAALVETIFKELTKLHFLFDRCIIMIYDQETNASVWWMANPEPGSDPVGVYVKYHEHAPYQAYLQAWKNQTLQWQYLLEGEVKKDWDNFIFSETDLSLLPPLVIKGMRDVESIYLNGSFSNCGSLTVATLEPLSNENAAILLRFARVFDLSYTRFNDLQKAEAQAHEAQIELSLERVRAGAMAMQKSTDLLEVIKTVTDQIIYLGIEFEGSNFVTINPDKSWFMWICTRQEKFPFQMHIPYFDHRGFIEYEETKKKNLDSYTYVYSPEENASWMQHFFEKSTPQTAFPEMTPERGEQLMQSSNQAASVFFFDKINFAVFRLTDQPFSEAENLIFKRIGKVFEQAYIRFTDLQKAEEQTREAQIELGLERVRARAMAMQKSEELKELIGTVSIELTKLDLALTRCTIMIFEPVTNDSTWWMANSEAPSDPIGLYVKYHNLPPYEAFLKEWMEGRNKWVYTLEGQDKKDWDEFLFSETELSRLPDFVIAGMKAPERVYLSSSFNNFGCLNLATLEQLSDEQFDILLRFAKVFDLTYTRFNDLQKAEAQAREAQIETGLERVRYSAMAMQSSEDVGSAMAVVFNEISLLGVETMRCGITVIHPDMTADVWVVTTTSEGKVMKGMGSIDFNNHPLWAGVFEAWKNKEESYSYDLKGDDLRSYYNILAQSPNYDSSYIQNQEFPDHTFYASFFEQGAVFTFSLLPHDNENRKVLKRFTAVFSLTFRRYLDLKQAEANTRESKIEAALERVRSRTLAMQKSDELAETAAELFRQLIGLGIEPNRLYIGIVEAETGDMEMWATDEDGTQVGKKFMFNKNENASVRKLYDGWAAKQKSVIVNMEGKELEEYFHYLSNVMHIPFKGGLTQKRRVQSVAYFSKGFIGMASPDGQGDQTIQLLERFAAVFNLTFTRFNDLKIAEAHAEQAEQDLIQLKEEKKRTEDALTELQVTQTQLIQSEKMASLGELTAGIAHEIQNPLNFVNNFSEVSTELVDEMNEEIQKGNLEDAQQIASDLKENLSKINHHGKRAGDIVRSMLQHSRSSSGQKELTDINELADEYLRLAYHGLRAKDKSFNASFTTDFDSSIPKINIIPQDIGRVILNLINNAFYAVSARVKQGDGNYQPAVTVATQKNEQSVLISVSDNGTGMPQKVVDKIFQPFFTTKPTGEGTGLGLSLSYDIVKAHGGEITVSSNTNIGSEFVISLPNNKI